MATFNGTEGNARAGSAALMRHAELGAQVPDGRSACRAGRGERRRAERGVDCKDRRRPAAGALHRIARRRPAPRAYQAVALLRLGAAAGGCAAVLVLVADDLLLGAAQVLLGHRRQVFGAGELAVAVLVRRLEVLREIWILLRFDPRQVAVIVPVKLAVCGIIR